MTRPAGIAALVAAVQTNCHIPSLPAAYAQWQCSGCDRALREVAARGRAHFERLAHEVLALHAQRGDEAPAAIAAWLSAPQAVCSG